MPTASIQIVGTQTPIGVNPAAKATAVDTAAIHRKPNPRCKNLKQSVGTQVTARPDKLIPRKKKINETATTLQGDGSEPVVPLGIVSYPFRLNPSGATFAGVPMDQTVVSESF
nr:hypothetical protein Iba_chr06cCG5350 [Ipomoea batatas]